MNKPVLYTLLGMTCGVGLCLLGVKLKENSTTKKTTQTNQFIKAIQTAFQEIINNENNLNEIEVIEKDNETSK